MKDNTQTKRQAIKLSAIGLATLSMAACAKRPIVVYNPTDFVNPNKVVVKKVKQKLPQPKVHASYGYENNPMVVKAYKRFSKTGAARTIAAKGAKTLAFDSYAHPIISCQPLHLCVIQLEHGEKINNIDIGDSAHWLVSTSLIGTHQDGAYQVVVKPKELDVATDMVIATNKRTYNIGLVSKNGEYSHIVNFYYPLETLNQAVEAASANIEHNAIFENETVDSTTHINVNHMNFDYDILGHQVSWKPTRVFDDGQKTFIQMPMDVDNHDLPVMYLLRDGKQQLVNYRYKAPYYIVDTLFNRAYLISGKGKHQIKIIIQNQHHI